MIAKHLCIALIALFSTVSSANGLSQTLPDAKSILNSFKLKESIGCYPLIDEGANYTKCLHNSNNALASMNIDYETFTLGQLRLLATRSPIHSSRMQNARFILSAIGHPIE